MKLIYTFLLIIMLSGLQAQKMFKKKLDGCSPNFKLENQEILVEYTKGDSLLINDLTAGAETKHIQRLKGIMALQIIIDTTGTSCLISYDQRFNMLRKPFDIEENTNTLKHWTIPKQNPYISVMIKVYFENKQITIERLGYNRNSGWTLLRENTFFKPEETQ